LAQRWKDKAIRSVERGNLVKIVHRLLLWSSFLAWVAISPAQSPVQSVVPDLGWHAAAKAQEAIASPDGRIQAIFAIMPATFQGRQEDELVYAVSYKGKALVDASPIRLELEGQPALGPNMKIDHVARASKEDHYTLLHGKTSAVNDHYNSIVIDLSDINGSPGNSSTQVWLAKRQLRIEARVYNDAVAFRYIVPDQPAIREFRLVQEDTEFRMAKDATVYAQELPDYSRNVHFRFVAAQDFMVRRCMPRTPQVIGAADQTLAYSTGLVGRK
jgi:hypothetical protein